MFNEFKEFWLNSFNFKGRARRREYWVANLYCSSVYLIITSILLLTVLFGTMVEDDSTGLTRVLLGIFCLILVLVLCVHFIMSTIAQVSLCVRRCHDLGYSGYIYLLCVLGSFCCGIGGIVWLVLCCMDSKQEDNQWGLYPKNILNNKYVNNNSIIASVTIYIVTLVIYICIYAIYSVSFSSNLIDSWNTKIQQKYSEDKDSSIFEKTDELKLENTNTLYDEEVSDIEEDTDLYNGTPSAERNDADDEDVQSKVSKSSDKDEILNNKEISENVNSSNKDDNSKQNTSTNFSSSSWKSFEVSVDGSIITLPCSFSELENLGYYIKDSYVDTSENLESDHYTTSIKLENEEGEVLFARFINYSEEDKTLDECDIYSVSVDSFYELPDLEVCGGLNMGMSLEEVLDTYGKPDYKYESDDSSYKSISYYAEPDKSYNGNLDIDFYEGKINVIKLESKKY